MSDESESIIFDDFFGDFSEPSSSSAIYSGEFRLIRVSPGEDGGVVKGLGKLPEQLEKTAHWTMAAYNGKLYFIGGYSYNNGSKGITKKVWIYDPKTKKWSAGKELPEGRAGGKAIQSGKNLIYTMGYSEDNAGKGVDVQKYPANLIFDGNSWKKSSVEESDSVEPYVIDGSVTSKKRMELVDKFNSDDTNVFLITLKAGGTGLNLTSADVVIHLDLWWNPQVENQATDRAYRIGQKNNVQVYKLITKNSIEEK
jgi:hypothetical protein